MQLRARVHGIDTAMRDLAKTSDEEKRALRAGIHEAAEFLKTKIEAKIGVYQPGWAKLTWETNKMKLRKWGFSGKPLLGSGGLKGSFYVHDSGGVTLMSSVGSTSDIIVHHVYGAPKVNLPARDPMLVTSDEQKDACRRIIIEHIYGAYK
jgi:phage gpG-like protein